MGLFKNHKFDAIADSSLEKQLHILYATPEEHIIDWLEHGIKKQEDELNDRLYQIKILDEKNKQYGDKEHIEKIPYPANPIGTGDSFRINNFNNTSIITPFDNPEWLAEEEARKNPDYRPKGRDSQGRRWSEVKKVAPKVGLYLAKIRSQIDGNLYLIVGTSDLSKLDQPGNINISKTIDLVNIECSIELNNRAALAIEYFLIKKFRPTDNADKYFNPYSKFNEYDRILNLEKIDDIVYLFNFLKIESTNINDDDNEFLIKGWIKGDRFLYDKYMKEKEELLLYAKPLEKSIKYETNNLNSIKKDVNSWKGAREISIKRHVSTMLKKIQSQSTSGTYNESDFADSRERYIKNSFNISDVCYGLMFSKNGKFAIDTWMENNNLKHISYWDLITNESYRLEFVTWVEGNNFFSNTKGDIDNKLSKCLKKGMGSDDFINEPSLLLDNVYKDFRQYLNKCTK
jgi:hypothetical protein